MPSRPSRRSTAPTMPSKGSNSGRLSSVEASLLVPNTLLRQTLSYRHVHPVWTLDFGSPISTDAHLQSVSRRVAREQSQHQLTFLQALDQVQGSLDGLMSGCQRSKAAVAGAQESTAGLLAETERLQLELAANEKRSSLVQRFLEQYQLSPAEVEALQVQILNDFSADRLWRHRAEEDGLVLVAPVPIVDYGTQSMQTDRELMHHTEDLQSILQSSSIGKEFFEALSRVRSIHANCKALLRTHHQRAGLELMDAMSAHQEGAYERLCRQISRPPLLACKRAAWFEVLVARLICNVL